jgi:hypothetical protein
MKLIELSRSDFARHDKRRIKDLVDENVLVVVRHFYDESLILDFRQELKAFALSREQSWHPLYNDCPDYHRINDEYENSYVKARTHTFLFHLWYEHNRRLFEMFKETFVFKSELLGKDASYVTSNIPSDGYISRVTVHQYPIGGGYLSEHVDPVNAFNPVQTIIPASIRGVDYKSGGLYVRPDGSDLLLLDDKIGIGDLVMFNQQIPHGVLPVEPDEKLTWDLDSGRWLIIPITVRSDYIKNQTENVKQLSFGAK